MAQWKLQTICQTPSWGAGRVCIGTWTSGQNAVSATPTPIQIYCSDPHILFSETSNLSVSGGTSPYTWYVTAGTGTISANSATISADYTAATTEETITVACLDKYHTYDSEDIVITNAEVPSADAEVGFIPHDIAIAGSYIYAVGYLATLSGANGNQYEACILKKKVTTFETVASATFTGDRKTDAGWNAFQNVLVCGDYVYATGSLSRLSSSALHTDNWWAQNAVIMKFDTATLTQQWKFECRFMDHTDVTCYGRGIHDDGTDVYFVGSYSFAGGIASKGYRVKLSSTTGLSSAVCSSVDTACDDVWPDVLNSDKIVVFGSYGGNRQVQSVHKTIAFATASTDYNTYTPLNYEHWDAKVYDGAYYVAGMGDPLNKGITLKINSNFSQAWETTCSAAPGDTIYNFGIDVDSTGVYTLGRDYTTSEFVLSKYTLAGAKAFEILNTTHRNVVRAIALYNNQIIIAGWDSTAGLHVHDMTAWFQRRSQTDGSLIT